MSMRRVHLLFEAVGVAVIVAGIGWLALRALFSIPASGSGCDKSEQITLPSPDGKRIAKGYHSACGAGYDRPYSLYTVDLSTGNPNKGYEYTPIVELKNVAVGEVTVAWDGTNQLSVTYPPSAEVVDAYAKTFDVQIVLHPSLPVTTPQ